MDEVAQEKTWKTFIKGNSGKAVCLQNKSSEENEKNILLRNKKEGQVGLRYISWGIYNEENEEGLEIISLVYEEKAVFFQAYSAINSLCKKV